MMMRLHHLAALLGLLAVALCASAKADYDLSWHSIDGGGGTSQGGPYTVTGSIGQYDGYVLTGGSYDLFGGFWMPPCPADINGDGVVDTKDLLILLPNWGSAGPDGDVDADGDVDTEDLQLLLASWGVCP